MTRRLRATVALIDAVAGLIQTYGLPILSAYFPSAQAHVPVTREPLFTADELDVLRSLPLEHWQDGIEAHRAVAQVSTVADLEAAWSR